MIRPVHHPAALVSQGLQQAQHQHAVLPASAPTGFKNLGHRSIPGKSAGFPARGAVVHLGAGGSEGALAVRRVNVSYESVVFCVAARLTSVIVIRKFLQGDWELMTEEDRKSGCCRLQGERGWCLGHGTGFQLQVEKHARRRFWGGLCIPCVLMTNFKLSFVGRYLEDILPGGGRDTQPSSPRLRKPRCITYTEYYPQYVPHIPSYIVSNLLEPLQHSPQKRESCLLRTIRIPTVPGAHLRRWRL